MSVRRRRLFDTFFGDVAWLSHLQDYFVTYSISGVHVTRPRYLNILYNRILYLDRVLFPLVFQRRPYVVAWQGRKAVMGIIRLDGKTT